MQRVAPYQTFVKNEPFFRLKRGIFMLMTEGIQSKKYIRENVVSAELLSAEGSSIILKTSAVIKSFANVSWII